jgi:FkbM family methyltransferase
MSAPAFVIDLLTTLLSGFRIADDRNVDPFRFPGRSRPDPVGLRSAARALLSILSSSRAAAASGESLRDDESRRLLLDLCAFRILGGRHYRLPRNDSFFWQSVESVATDLVAERAVSRAGGYVLDLYRIEGKTGVIELEAHPMNVLNTFLIEEYRLARPGRIVEAGAGDIVIDGGGCWGDTALYFADRIGDGKVFVFEFEPENLEVLRRNFARNPRLAEKCEVVEYALWDGSADHLNVAVAGPGTRVVEGAVDAATRRVRSLAIDDWARDAGVSRIDFIKMDIEGAETRALDGARGTIRSQAPRLAISTYHSLRDLVTLPALLGSMRSDYEVFLAHATIHAEETIAFARPG